MNREILFRGKRVDNGDWVEGFLFDWIKRGVKIPIIGEGVQNGSVMGFEFHPDTAGQFTGLLDKNGKRIFEGDVLLTDTIVQFVKFNECLACWGVAQNNNSATMSIDKSWEIIGNIHDNPELINSSRTSFPV